MIKRYVEVAQLLTKAITEHANLDTSLNIDKYGIESSCLLNESNANTLYHMDFQVPTNLHSWAEINGSRLIMTFLYIEAW